MSGASPGSSPAPASPHEPGWAKPSIGIYQLGLFLIALIGSVVIFWLTKDDKAFMLLIGAVIANSGVVVQYYFGSSSGSDRKTDLIGAGGPKP